MAYQNIATDKRAIIAFLALLAMPQVSFAQGLFAEGQQPVSALAESPFRHRINAARELRDLIRSDPHRPIFHFVAPEGIAFAFDPNGAIYWKGKYHLGYIYHKIVDGKRQAVWGHAVSTDLLHWALLPDMLDVKQGDLEEGVASGGAFVSREGIPHLVYHGAGASANLLARAIDDDLRVWEKLKEDGILKEPQPAQGRAQDGRLESAPEYTVFDPDISYDPVAGYYYQISGGMKPAIFKSRDLRGWTFVSSAIDRSKNMIFPFEDLSCPDLFAIDNKHMMIFISHALGAQYFVGTFKNGIFTAEQHGRMNWPGGTFFAPEQLRDATGRNIFWGWIIQPPKPAHLRNYGWSGIMSLPRIVSLDKSGTVRIDPAPELNAIRTQELRERRIELGPNQEAPLQAKGKSLELQVELAGGRTSPFGLKVFASADGREETVIRYEPAKGELVVDFVKSSISGPVSLPPFIFDPEFVNPTMKDQIKPLLAQFPKQVSEQRAPLKLAKGETLKLNVFLDRSVIEVFANGRQVVTQVVYPELEASTGMKLFSGNEPVTMRAGQSWKMAETNAY